MAADGSSDRLHLLDHSSRIPRKPTSDGDSQWIHEMIDFDSLDIGIPTSPVAQQYPPAYSSIWEQDNENDKKNESKSGTVYSQRIHDPSPTFSTIDPTKPASINPFLRFLAFIRRSGRYALYISDGSADLNRTGKPYRFSGWRGGVLAATLSAGTVLLMNLIFTIWAAAKSKSGFEVGSIFAGECEKVRKADSMVHVAINVMGTLLLGASNYTMQCLSSPTRQEVDVAHSRGKYLDIGLPSLNNLTGWKKKFVFTFLVLSTLPLHFLWNSAVFTTTQQLDYNVFVVTPKFFNNSTVDCSQNVSVHYDPTATQYGKFAQQYNQKTPLGYDAPAVNYTATRFDENVYSGSSDYWYQNHTCNISKTLLTNSIHGTLTRLSNEDCINTYGPGDTFLKGYGNVLAVTKEQPANSNGTILMQFIYEQYTSNYTGSNWVCDPEHLINNDYTCKYRDIAANADGWTLGSPRSDPNNNYRLIRTEQWPIDYCLAQPTNLTGMCQLQYSLVIMIIVLIANSIKFSCILFILWTHLEPVLATIGDGIASFLERPDFITVSRPFLDRKHARKFKLTAKKTPMRWYEPKYSLRWWHAPALTRWSLTLTLCTIAIITAGFLLVTGNDAVMSVGTFNSPYDIAFGAYNAAATLTILTISNSKLTSSDFSSNSILMGMVAVANLPQVIVSCLYFAYNTVYTSMVSADEWSRFTFQRKGLRTTNPRGEQRSTYWLSLPWTYALPLAIANSVLHWLISQSIFVARTEILDTYGNPEPISYMQVGYSPLGILISLLFGSGMVLAMILNGFRKLKGGVLVGNNSLAISAACHRSVNDVGAELRRVQWGALHHSLDDGTPGHCCFSSEEVEPPKPGVSYI